VTPGETEFELWGGIATVATTDPGALPVALAAVRETVAEFDAACSSYRTDSELAAVNAGAGSVVQVSELLLDAVAAALRAAALTDGDVDPTVGQALIAYGFGPGGESRDPIRIEAVPGVRSVKVDPVAGTVSVGRGVRLDLGATAKAMAADRAAARACAAAGCSVLVALLGDIALAGPAPEGGWPVRVTDDHRGGIDAPGQTVTIKDGGVASSSTTTRRRGNAHHLIDPRTSTPVRSPYRTATVAAGSCLDANIAATAALIRGPRAAEWVTALGLPARLVRVDGTVERFGGWPDAGDELPAADRSTRSAA
jgi:FAD:protein FMN transferase